MSKDGIVLGNEGFQHFWNKGVSFWDSATIQASNIPNPTFYFCFRGDRFNLHYGLEPMFGFSIAPLLVPCKDLDFLEDSTSSGTRKFQRVAEFAFSQFTDYGESLRLVLADHDVGRMWPPVPAATMRGLGEFVGVEMENKTRFVVRFMNAEVLAFCKALDDFAVTGERETVHFTMPQCGEAIVLDGGDYCVEGETVEIGGGDGDGDAKEEKKKKKNRKKKKKRRAERRGEEGRDDEEGEKEEDFENDEPVAPSEVERNYVRKQEEGRARRQ
ncbi:hypothetical protein BC829DRAFT_116248 [Chytridium lagenaria]|nr:hypothetical protein BC829DRAFT_116248 [Chytridium lagenaria]